MPSLTRSSLMLYYAAYCGYTVDQCGNVYGPTGARLQLIEKQYTRMRYLAFSVRDSKLKVHRFVAFLKFGSAALRPKVHIRHFNGDSFDNNWDNLVLGSQSENEMDKPEEYRRERGRRNALHLPAKQLTL